jgi:hypothetical protein
MPRSERKKGKMPTIRPSKILIAARPAKLTVPVAVLISQLTRTTVEDAVLREIPVQLRVAN